MARRSFEVDNFAREIEKILDEIPDYHRDLQAELAGHAIDACVERSPVLTGAYRASHTVTSDGGSGPGGVIYEGPERVADDLVVPTYPLARYEPANGADAAEDVKAIEPFQRIEIRNGRFHASLLEYGTPTMAPRSIYASAELETEVEAKRIDERELHKDFEEIMQQRGRG